MKYLVTGSLGFIGSNVTKRLLDNKDNIVIGIDNMNNYYDIKLKEDRLNELQKNNNYKFYKETIANKEKTFETFANEKPDYVIDLAAQAGGYDTVLKIQMIILNQT